MSIEKEFSKTKIVVATVSGIAFLAMVTLFMVTLMQNPIKSGSSVQKAAPAEVVSEKEEMMEAQKSPYEIEFSDPGNDEIGQEIKALDDLVNDTMPSEYDEEALSDEEIDGAVELQ